MFTELGIYDEMPANQVVGTNGTKVPGGRQFKSGPRDQKLRSDPISMGSDCFFKAKSNTKSNKNLLHRHCVKERRDVGFIGVVGFVDLFTMPEIGSLDFCGYSLCSCNGCKTRYNGVCT